MSAIEQELLGPVLRDVSRSFYQSLRILPGAVRPQISLAYLLARTSDTLADLEIVPAAERLRALDWFSRRVAGGETAPYDFSPWLKSETNGAELLLLEKVEGILSALKLLEEGDQSLVRQVLATIFSGQRLDLQRFSQASSRQIVPLETSNDLEDYTFRVAGTVGEFWTRLCHRHLIPSQPEPAPTRIQSAIRFGQGLQLVNILRDLAPDLRMGRCYLPRAELQRENLEPAELLQPENWPRLRPLHQRWVDQAEEYLREGWAYTLDWPRGLWRVRLACAWPILIGLQTLKLLRVGNPLDPAVRIKISRTELRALLFQSLWKLPFPRAWARLPDSG